MAKTTEEKSAPSGFVTTKEAVTLPGLSLAIWIATGMTYKMAYLTFKDINYEATVCITSCVFSIAASYFFVKGLIDKTSPKPVFLVALNALMLYSSANGIQSGYSFMASNGQKAEASSVKMSGFQIPFLDARPWIPDNNATTENTELRNQNKVLLVENSKLRQAGVSQNPATNNNMEIARLQQDLQQRDSLINYYTKSLANVTARINAAANAASAGAPTTSNHTFTTARNCDELARQYDARINGLNVAINTLQKRMNSYNEFIKRLHQKESMRQVAEMNGFRDPKEMFKIIDTSVSR
jgi:hypothetical protein